MKSSVRSSALAIAAMMAVVGVIGGRANAFTSDALITSGWDQAAAEHSQALRASSAQEAAASVQVAMEALEAALGAYLEADPGLRARADADLDAARLLVATLSDPATVPASQAELAARQSEATVTVMRFEDRAQALAGLVHGDAASEPNFDELATSYLRTLPKSEDLVIHWGNTECGGVNASGCVAVSYASVDTGIINLSDALWGHLDEVARVLRHEMGHVYQDRVATMNFAPAAGDPKERFLSHYKMFVGTCTASTDPDCDPRVENVAEAVAFVLGGSNSAATYTAEQIAAAEALINLQLP